MIQAMLGGAAVDLMHEDTALQTIASAMRQSAGRPIGVVSANLDHLHHFGHGGANRGVIEHTRALGTMTWLTLLDGAPLVRRANRLTGQRWPRLAGSDLIGPVLDRAERYGARVGFLGGMPETQALLQEQLAEQRPGLLVAGFWAPERDELADQASMVDLANAIAAAGVDVLVVGLGKPRQEEWIARYGVASGAKVLLAFGAVVDFLAGRVVRAPDWVSIAGLEWAWRLALEPRRLARRYLAQGPSAYLLLRRQSHVGVSTNHQELLPDGSVLTRPDRWRAPRAGGVLPPSASGAVIIPAHNEAAVIARTLRSLAPLTALPGIEVIVVSNGSADDTAKVARSFPGVRVEELDLGSKTNALNYGDSLATTWPRLYLDADIEVAPASVLGVFDALSEPGVLAARAYYVYDCVGASFPVRAYYRARSRASAPPLRLWGAGGYATNEQGHARFGTFPTITADDSWFDAQFSDEEKRVVAVLPMRVRTPRNCKGLLAVLARQRRGYVELGMPSKAGRRVQSLFAGLRNPRSAVDAGCYVILSVLSRGQAFARTMRRAKHAHGGWERDGSSRLAGQNVP